MRQCVRLLEKAGIAGYNKKKSLKRVSRQKSRRKTKKRRVKLI